MQEPLVPSINFAMVCPGVYRSGYPTKKNYRFIRALRLRTILYLCPEEYAESNVKFCEENGINILRFPTEGNKEPFMDISESLMHRILTALIDTRIHPVLIHCNKGKHRTGTVVGCLRLLQGWSLVSIFQEYRSFAGDKVRMGDQQYVELYHPIVRVAPPYVAEWVCITPIVTVVESERELLEAESRQLGWSLVSPPTPPAAQQPDIIKTPVEQPGKKNVAVHSNKDADAAISTIKSAPVTAPPAATAATTTSHRASGHIDGNNSAPKVKETTTVSRKELGESKKSQK
ncbi:tyrosine phosphatase [Trypanosoma theileri]|uniref:diphosphoinositol-polyphosphate diphosphatase n=1 Tax=Trypanosoma theileri TaxID=67003 RepID=A0A1X0NMS4_9TRYP|nr:tyrosine phosphatase [Trypanosoma theileri]ORC85430.1 tyrosine phosphatase [Trypanosoma theileri]